MLPQSWTARPDHEARATPPAVAPEQPTAFWSAVGRGAITSAEDQIRTRSMGAREFQWHDALMQRHTEIERITGQRLRPSAEMMRTELAAQNNSRRQSALPYASREEYEEQIDAYRRRFPELANLPTRDQLWQRHEETLTGIRQRSDEAASDGTGGMIGSFVGGSAAAMLDPVNLGAALATGGVGAGRPLLARMAAQAGVGAGVEIAQTPGRAADAANFGGPEYTGAEAVMDVTMGAAAGAGMELVMDAGKWVWRRAARQLASSEDPLQRGVADKIETLMDDEVLLEGVDDFDSGLARLNRGEPPPPITPDRDLEALFANADAQPPRGVVPLGAGLQPETAGQMQSVDYMGRTIWSGRFDPLQVEADAARFQYKAQGDSEGVTARLQGIERWDTTASGKALLFQDTDGQIYVADGHQRRGLARRLAEQGWEDARLDGYLFRAADGWTDRQVRVIAALKNIREGSGTIMDAAKLFREAPGALKDRSLPMTGDFIHQARQLAGLSDAAFRAVANGIIPERYGAVIGELAADRPDLQGDLVDLVRRADPGSAEGARSLVHEALLDDFIASEGVQMDMFGALPRESTVIARGRIREAVMRSLRKDQRTFAALVKNADAVEAGGNVLARNENEARLALDKAAQELVSRLSLRSGDIGDAFSDAARAVTVGELSAAEAARGLTQRIRNAIKAGELLEAERKVIIDPDPPGAAALAHARAFDAPAGAGQKAQLEPKPEDAELEAGPPVVAVLRGDEITLSGDRTEDTRNLTLWLKQKFGQKSVNSEALSRPVKITSSGLNKTARTAAPEVMRVVPAIADILQKGRLIDTELDNRGRSNVRAYHTLQAIVDVGGERVRVVAKVREQTDGSIYWGLFKDDGRLDASGQAQPVQRGQVETGGGSDRQSIIEQSDDDLNLAVQAVEEETQRGLFDDIFDHAEPEQRALDVLAQCAPGSR